VPTPTLIIEEGSITVTPAVIALIAALGTPTVIWFTDLDGAVIVTGSLEGTAVVTSSESTLAVTSPREASTTISGIEPAGYVSSSVEV
jgi:hypothetical protein